VPWRLEIHHIDVIANGDATLIVARQVPPVAPGPNIRSVLIDGGLFTAAAQLDGYLGMQLGAAPLNAIICTHYDNDHVNGLSYLLRQAGRYNNTFIYDQGWPGDAGQEANYIRFLRAINGIGNNGPVAALAGVLNRTRVTSRVQADGAPPIALPAVGGAPAIPGGGLVMINRVPQWLLTGAAPADPLWNGAGVAAPAGAPTMRFIAANGYVRTAAPGIAGPFLGLGIDPKNEKSLAVEVRFGNFRYYAGGDLETPQENAVQTLLNVANNAGGRVLAMKTSHHGSATATSGGFVDQLRPSAAFLSCGTQNRYTHPDQQTINVLDGYLPLAVPHGPPPPLPSSRPVDYYLTGYQLAGPPPLTYGGDRSLTAGDPTVVPRIRGHVRVTVTAPQSLAAVQGQLFFAVQAAVQAALTAPGLAGAMVAGVALPIANAAAEGAMFTGVGPTASTVINQAGGPAVAGTAADAAANGPIPAGVRAIAMANVVTLAALNAGVPAVAAHAAGAGAAAGAIYGGADNNAVQSAVASAVFTAGAIGWPAALAYGAAAAAPLAAAPQFTVRLYNYYEPLGAGWVNITHQ
jgi:hypothetical protein